MSDVAIIGCGIIGSAIAYELSKYRLHVVVLEKENDVGCGGTKANSAIIHAGYDPEPGTLMAKFNVEGVSLAKKICKKLDVPHRECGSLVLAFNNEEEAQLLELYEQGKRNGVTPLELLAGRQAKILEPALNSQVTKALFAPGAMIVIPWEYALALMETAMRNGVELMLNNAVTGIERKGSLWQIKTAHGVLKSRFVINAAGVHSADVHNLAAPEAFKIIPDRGEYYLLDKSEGGIVNRVIFQCPTKAGKGTLVSPTVHGNIIVGPNNEIPKDNDDTVVTASSLEEIAEKALKSVPSLNFRMNIRNFAGIRAASDEKDFIIREAEGAPGFFDVAGIKSPGLTAAPAIAVYIAELLRERGLEAKKKDMFIDTRRRLRFSELSIHEKNDLVRKEPAYGKIVCRCETITEGEILSALATPIPPHSLDGVKRRCGPGMGRCQGGFCGPRITKILADYYHIDPTSVLQDREGSYILTGETKLERIQEGAVCAI